MHGLDLGFFEKWCPDDVRCLAETGRARASRSPTKYVTMLPDPNYITKPYLSASRTCKHHPQILDFRTYAILFLQINTSNQQDAPNIQHAPVPRAYGVADPEPAPSVVLDKGWPILWQGQHWYVMRPLFAQFALRGCFLFTLVHYSPLSCRPGSFKRRSQIR
jgi:hypothetical protein